MIVFTIFRLNRNLTRYDSLLGIERDVVGRGWGGMGKQLFERIKFDT